MPLFAWTVALLLTIGASLANAQPAQITIVQPAEATTMDPGRSTQVLTVNYFYNLYDSLLRWDTAMQLQPGLATAWRAVNDTTWEFTLRSGVKFHDGAPLTADDVRATLERNLIPGKTVVTAGFTTIESVRAVTPTLVRVITKKPDPLLPVRMAQMGSQILPARLTTDDGVKELARRPVGSGAYRFVQTIRRPRRRSRAVEGGRARKGGRREREA
jgi:peptide/nickel transport system substrate-binding protein